MRIAIVALALALWAGVAGSQTVVQNGQSTRGTQQLQLVGGIHSADSTGAVFVLDNSGNLSTINGSADRDFVRLWPSILSGTNLAAAAADSSAPIDVHAYRYLKLLIKIVPRTAANLTVRVAFQFREHMNSLSDSSSTFPEYQYARADQGVLAGTTGVDTTYAGHIVTGTVSLPWSGEYVLTFNMNRSAPGNGVAAQIFSYPNGVSLPLDNVYGRPARFNSLSIRIRNLNITGPAIDYTVSLLGFAQ